MVGLQPMEEMNHEEAWLVVAEVKHAKGPKQSVELS